MVINSLILSCNSFSSGLKLSSPAPPTSSQISRRALFLRPTAILKSSSLLDRTPILTAEMASTNKSTSEPIAQEDAKKISTDEKTLALTENTGLNLGGTLSTLVNIPTWAKFALGSIVLLAIPVLRKFHSIKDVTKAVEGVAEMVEKAAEMTEKVAEEIAEALPEGGLKEAVVKLDKIALLVDKEAELTESIIDKVDDVVKAVDTNLKIVEEEVIKKNTEEDKVTLKKIVVEQSTETLKS